MAKTAKKSKSGESEASPAALGCLLLIALPFALIGAGAACLIVRDLWRWQSAQSWVETPATLLASNLEVKHGDDSSTFSVTAHYSYEFLGKKYENDRVALHGGSDNIGSYHRDRAAELEAIRKAGGKTVCYVNPDDPEQAMLFRDLRPGLVAFMLMFAVVFGGVGFGLLGGGFVGFRRAKRHEQLKKEKPGKPWLWREDWAAGRIRSSEGALAWFIGFFATFWNLVSWPIFFMVLNDAERRNGAPILLVALFPLVGAGVAAWAAYLWLRRLKWGLSEFEMAAVPGVLGGPLAGMIHAPRGIRTEKGFVLRLLCNKTTKVSSGGDSSTETKALWSRDQTIDRDLSAGDGGGTLIPVKFLVPYDLPPSGDHVKWQLEVRAETLGIDYFAAFEVPVFRTAASSSAVTTETAADEPDVADAGPEPLATTVARMNARLVEELPGSRTIVFPMARNRGMAAFTAMFAAVWTAACVGLFLSPAPRIFPWAFSLVELMVLYFTLETCFGSTRLEYSGLGIAYWRRWFGLGRRRDVSRNSITSIDVDKSGAAYGSTIFRKIVAKTAHSEHTLVSEIAREQVAERLAADLRSTMGLESTEPRMQLEGELPSDFLDQTKTSR